MTPTERIVEYLTDHGRMSGTDICNDLDVGSADLAWAYSDRAIVRCVPAPGGSGPWFCLP